MRECTSFFSTFPSLFCYCSDVITITLVNMFLHVRISKMLLGGLQWNLGDWEVQNQKYFNWKTAFRNDRLVAWLPCWGWRTAGLFTQQLRWFVWIKYFSRERLSSMGDRTVCGMGSSYIMKWIVLKIVKYSKVHTVLGPLLSGFLTFAFINKISITFFFLVT